MKTVAKTLLLFASIGLSLCRPALAQAPVALSDVVMAFDAYDPMAAHSTQTYHRWLKADGSYVDITREVTFGGTSLEPLPPESGRFTYSKDTPTTGQITFVGGRGYTLTFTNATAGRLIESGRPQLANGTFTIRPSQFGVGPSNLSTRTFLTPNGATIAGFVISGADRRFVLFRAVGPGLTTFGLANTATKMGVTANGLSGPIGSAADWSASSNTIAIYQNLFAISGAFALTPGQGDACLLLELAPGAYTAQMTSDGGGNALIEVYFLP